MGWYIDAAALVLAASITGWLLDRQSEPQERDREVCVATKHTDLAEPPVGYAQEGQHSTVQSSGCEFDAQT